MLRVIFRSGKVVQYNTATCVTMDKETATLREKGGTSDFITIVPWDVIERIESNPKPFRVYKTAPLRRLDERKED